MFLSYLYCNFVSKFCLILNLNIHFNHFKFIKYEKISKLNPLSFCLIIVAISSVSCSKNDDPADNDLFVGTYKGHISYTDADGKKSANDGSVTVVKAGGEYYFRFSDGMPDLKGVRFKKDGEPQLW